MRTKIFVAVAVMALLATPAYAQATRATNNIGQVSGKANADKEARPVVDEKAYERSLSNIQEKKYDPWKNAR